MSAEMHQFIEKNVASVAPIQCEFRLGDTVTVINGYGVEIPGKKIIGFVQKIDPEFRPEAIIYLDWDCYWFSVAPEKLKLESRQDREPTLPRYAGATHGDNDENPMATRP
ncbi:hypothetical protein [Pseudomonas savastanoi]|uniref:hypothetical protein n=1 Tax=Pseudomonas savastanoi TaxID=29438 RepID=UPI0019680C1B|nr:hypothetical protein [Pseudomonas savastanoi]